MKTITNNLSPKLLTSSCASRALGDQRDTKSDCAFIIEEIHLRANTITPCLQKILDLKPHWHWGINE